MKNKVAEQVQYTDISGERKLLSHVMLQALEDLYRPPKKYTKIDLLTWGKIHVRIDGKCTAPYEYRDAMRWFKSDDDAPWTFVYVCVLLDLDVGVVRKRAMEIAEKNIKCNRPDPK